MIYFISDLHLSPQTPGIFGCFKRFLSALPATPETQLFILGDLFEAWVGDDDLSDPFNQSVAKALSAATTTGISVSVMHGNRDFLLGEDFAAFTGIHLLSDPYVLSTPEWQFVLSHGDALCTDDLAYQQFRQQVRSPQWRSAFLAKPLAERLEIARQLREASESGKQGKTAEIMDVNPVETEDFLRQHGYATFIHGHTHRPAQHDHIVDGIHVERWVLSDWHEHCGESLCWNGAALQRHTLL